MSKSLTKSNNLEQMILNAIVLCSGMNSTERVKNFGRIG